MVTEKPIQVVIVDDHAMLRKGLAVFLLSYSDLKLIGEASNGEEALLLCAEKHPDIVLMDLMMPIMDGVTATRHIRESLGLAPHPVSAARPRSAAIDLCRSRRCAPRSRCSSCRPSGNGGRTAVQSSPDNTPRSSREN